MTTETAVLSPEQVDDLCIKYDDARIQVDNAQQDLSSVKGDLLAAVRAQGYIPANAEKTTRLEGVIYVADATEGSTVSVNEAAVAELQSELSRLKKPRVFKELFARRVSHSLKKGAGDTLKLAVGNLDDDTQKRILGIFASCFSVETKAPSLKVQLVQALREKEAKPAKAKKGRK